jgi:hypothetical protein
MARIRTIKPEFWQDEKLAPCDPMTRLVFLGLISMADDCGRVLDNVKVIDAFIFPESAHSSHEALMRLSGMARIRRGRTASGQRVIQIVNWEAHQKVQHPNLKGSLPELVEEQELTTAHEPLMNGSGGAHEPLTHHTNDQRPTTNDLRPSSAVQLVTDDPAPRSTPAAPRPNKRRGQPAPWLGAIRKAHEDRYGAGSFTPALAGRFLRTWGGIVAAHGEERAALTWHHANRPTNPDLRFVTPERVAAAYNDHDPKRIVSL